MTEQPRPSDFPPEAAPPIDDEHRNEPAEQDEDIAAEHDDLTVGEQERGGPEGTAEDESPQGYGGADLPGHAGND
ncbi:MAG TPA: hypothetical protein VFC19_54595 [Candidatus Limnocylindrales bacterium]|nr:hypothetical protein [Candidatus Limnocylindrales bacterium]